MKGWVVSSTALDKGDYVVTIRPDWEKSWKWAAIGGVLSPRDAQLVKRWLDNRGLEDLWTILKNVVADNKPGEDK